MGRASVMSSTLVVSADSGGVDQAMHLVAGQLVAVAEHGRLRVDVIDQGKGSAAIGKAAGCFGLFSIRERAQAMGADFKIASAPGKGTRATLILPTR